MKKMKTLIALCSLASVLFISACATTSHDSSSNGNGNTEVYGTVKAGVEGSSTK